MNETVKTIVALLGRSVPLIGPGFEGMANPAPGLSKLETSRVQGKAGLVGNILGAAAAIPKGRFRKTRGIAGASSLGALFSSLARELNKKNVQPY